MQRKPNIALVGASGLVGMMMLKVLEEREIEIGNLYLFASSTSAGKVCKYLGKDYLIQELKHDSFENAIDIALFASNKDISKNFIPICLDKGIYVIDNSSYYRNDLDIPLVIAGINDEAINSKSRLIVNPNCSTIQAVLALWNIDKLFKIKRIIYSTYQAVSGSGYKGVLDLVNTIEGKMPKFYEKTIAFNLIPIIGDITEAGNSSEELKMINETKRLLKNEDLYISATCTRVPVINSHSISIDVECMREINLALLFESLASDKSLKLYYNDYPTPREVSGSDLVHIGRLRKTQAFPNGLSLFVVADNLRVGAATNAIRILKKLMEEIKDVI